MRKLLIFITFLSIGLLASCKGSLNGFGVGRRPFIDETPAPTFSMSELADLAKIQRDYPDLFSKLQKHANTNADKIHAYNLEALKDYRAGEEALGTPKGDIEAMLEVFKQRYHIRS